MNLLRAWVGTPAAEAAGWTLMHSLWEGAVVALALAASLAVLRGSRARYAAACVALLVLLTGMAVTFERSLPDARTASMLEAGRGGHLPRIPAADSVTNAGLAGRGGLAYLPWLTPLWMAGVLAFQLRAMAGWMAARRLRTIGVCAPAEMWRERVQRLSQRIGLSRPVMLLESCLAEAPAVIGYVRPVILVPVGALAGLPADQVEAILLHELAHIRRHDYLVNLLQMFAESLVFYHPAVWWISSVIRAEREHCCDDAVLQAQGDPHRYASALAALESRRAMDRAVLASTGGNLTSRIRRLLAPAEVPRVGLTPVLSAVILTVAIAGAMAAWARPADPQDTEVYRKWLQQDVPYIITDEERAAFRNLQSDPERERFIEQFWLRRDPTPGTDKNEMKEEHYRRIAYANEHFVEGVLPGWKTDRGRVFIVYGPPDEKEVHPAGPASYSFEQWLYRHIEGIGNNVVVEFADRERNGEYRLTMDPAAIEPVQPQPAKAGASVLHFGSSAVLMRVPLDALTAKPLHVSVRITTMTGRIVKRIEAPVRGQADFSQLLALPAGAYRLQVWVSGDALRVIAADDLTFEVK